MASDKSEDDHQDEASIIENPVEDTAVPVEAEHAAKSSNKFKQLFAKYLSHKKITIPATVVVLLVAILAVPASRYLVLGTFLKENFSVMVLDNKTHKPVSSATVTMAGKSATTDKDGKAKLKVKVGTSKLLIQKKYYQDYSARVTAAFPGGKNTLLATMIATGRQVPLTITNKITGNPLENATVKAAGTEVKTDKKGTATIVLPADKTELAATISGEGYNKSEVKITITEQAVAANKFQIVPAGKIYFLSKLSGRIDVVKTDLDGSNRVTVLPGTGKEEDRGTVLLASRDWKYLALLSRRDSDKPKLYLIETASDKLTTMDEGDASFNIVGWQGSSFIYSVYRNNVKNWEPKQTALKSYNADTRKIVLLDETAAEGTNDNYYASEFLSSIYALKDVIIYNKNWQANYYSAQLLDGKQASIISVQADGSHKTTLKSFGRAPGSTWSSISYDARAYEPGGIYFKYNPDPNSSNDEKFLKYEDGKVSDTTEVTSENFFNTSYPTYLLSPSGSQTFWSDSRDGKNTLFVGNDDGEDEKQAAVLSEFTPYGWYTDSYLLVSKTGSELFIMPVGGGTPLKVTDYHKPSQNFYGYGGGYGGI